MKKMILLALVAMAGTAAFAKLPAASDEAKARAAEAAAKTAWAGKVDGYLLCKSQDKVAAQHSKAAKAAGKPTKPAATTCVDPGPFVYTPAVAPAGAPAAAVAPAPAASAAPAKKP